MDQALRNAYLRAMGVTPWVRRGGPSLGSAGDPGRGGQSGTVPSQGQIKSASPGSAMATDPGADGPLTGDGSVLDLAPESGIASLDWGALTLAVAGCRACGLHETRTQTVFGVGNPQAELLVIGEAPGADEDREGEPFVGRAGQLLNRMLAAIGLPRHQVYIANILKCRPPGNRDPRPEEVLSCQAYLMRQIALVEPRVILAVGRISAQTLLGSDLSLGRLRGRWLELGPQAIPLRVTYHPAYLLRSPDQKGRAWEDLVAVARRLGA